MEDLIKLSSKKKEIELKYDLERNVNLIKFSEGNIDISLNENLGKNFVRNLSKKLQEWTGKRWVITLTKNPSHLFQLDNVIVRSVTGCSFMLPCFSKDFMMRYLFVS